jgi:site-specific DNA-methyltransferase (adenine-specific)
VELYNDDCVDVLKGMEEGIIDLTVTSPPYDNLRTYNDSLIWNENIWKTVLKELYRVTKDGGCVVWVVGDATIKGSETGTSFKQALYAKECGFNIHDTMIYSKAGFANPSNNRYHQTFEYMFVFSKGKPKVFNPIKDRKNIYKKRGGDCKRQKDGTMKKGNKGGLPLNEFGQRYNIWHYKIGGGNISTDKIGNHPAMFPEQLAKDHVVSWSNKSEVVLDPFMGSGTVGVVCIDTKRNFIGIEKDEKYFEIAKARIEHAKSKPKQLSIV